MTLLLVITQSGMHAVSLPTMEACISLGAMFLGSARVFCVVAGVGV